MKFTYPLVSNNGSSFNVSAESKDIFTVPLLTKLPNWSFIGNTKLNSCPRLKEFCSFNSSDSMFTSYNPTLNMLFTYKESLYRVLCPLYLITIECCPISL